MKKYTISVLVVYLLVSFFILSMLFPKEYYLIMYNIKKYRVAFMKLFDPIVFELKQYLLYYNIVYGNR